MFMDRVMFRDRVMFKEMVMFRDMVMLRDRVIFMDRVKLNIGKYTTLMYHVKYIITSYKVVGLHIKCKCTNK